MICSTALENGLELNKHETIIYQYILRLHVQIIWRNESMCLNFMSFIHTEMAQSKTLLLKEDNTGQGC